MPSPREFVSAGLPYLKVRYRYALQHEEELPRYPSEPVRFIEEQLGQKMWSKQREVLDALAIHRRVAVHSAHATGKSWTGAQAVAHWISEKDDPFAVTTAPTGPQIKAILWKEIGRAHARGGLRGRLNQTEWWVTVNGHEELVAYGRKPSDYDQAAFQGIHSAAVLVVIDEASGVPESIFIAGDIRCRHYESLAIPYVYGKPTQAIDIDSSALEAQIQELMALSGKSREEVERDAARAGMAVIGNGRRVV